MSNIILANRSVERQDTSKNKEGTRMELAACAAQFFAQQGYHGTSTQVIAQHCRIRKASLFHHYKTKEDIALAAIQYVHNECDQHIFKHAENTELAAQERVGHFLAACEHFFTKRVEGLLPTLLGLELGDTQVFAQAIEAYFNAWVDSVTTLLQPLCVNAEQARQVARQSVTLMQGYLVVSRIQQNIQFSDLSDELRELWLKATE